MYTMDTHHVPVCQSIIHKHQKWLRWYTAREHDT